MISNIITATQNFVTPNAVEAATVQSYFTPLHYLLYLGIIFVVMVVFYEWKWTKDCRDSVLLLVVRTDGSTRKLLVPKEGGSVTIKNPKNDTVRTWPINRLSAIDVLYPGVSFVPEFLQKQIRMVIVDEDDWEPLINRGSYNENVASPDVVVALKALAKADGLNEAIQKRLQELVDNLNAAPTREMIASPAVLGNLIHEKITEAVITINKEVLESISALMKRLDKLLNPTIIYIGLGLIIVLLVYMVFRVTPSLGGMEDMAKDVIKIKQSLGIP